MLSKYQTEIRVCPVCHTPGSNFKTKQRLFELVSCPKCGMLYTKNPFTIENKKAHYREMARRCKDSRSTLATAFYTLANQIKSVQLYSRATHAIRQHFPDEDVNIVDVGCAGGLFLLAVQVAEDAFNLDKPSRFHARGVAFDPKEKDDAERFTGCQTFMLEDAGANIKNWADVVTMFNVLEHVNNPSLCLGTVKDILRDGGILVIDIPNNQVLKWRAKLQRK